MNKIIKFTTDVNTCDHCGTAGLRGTYAVQIEPTGEVKHYGVNCTSGRQGFDRKVWSEYLKRKANSK